VDFLSIGQDQTLSRCQTPDQSNIVFFAAAGGSGLTGGECFRIGESEAPVGEKT
jgi:hypothetical protein